MPAGTLYCHGCSALGVFKDGTPLRSDSKRNEYQWNELTDGHQISKVGLDPTTLLLGRPVIGGLPKQD